MKCPYCDCKELKVVDSREAIEGNAIRRRRECLGCCKRFTTFETLELSIQVHKRDGRYEDFNQQKLIAGLSAACHHTTISHDQVIALSAEINNEIMEKQLREIDSRSLGEMVMNKLKSLDPIAHIRFACVYRRFKDIGELVEAIQGIQEEESLR